MKKVIAAKTEVTWPPHRFREKNLEREKRKEGKEKREKRNVSTPPLPRNNNGGEKKFRF